MYGYISHSELSHHGIKGMKWGVRKQRHTSNGYRNSQSSTKLSPDKRKAIAFGVLGAIGAAAVVGGGVAAIKNPEAVGRALTSIKGAFAKAPKQKILSAGKAVGKGMRKVAFSDQGIKSAKESAKVFMKNKEIKKQWRKDTAGKVKSTVKSIASKTSGGVLDGLKGAAKELSSREEIAKTVKVGVKQGVTGAAIAAISGGIGLGVKSAISGKKPSRQEVTNYMTKNPNKKK